MFKAFAAVCEEHGLVYYAAFGTALGAVRHGGFIPWDDDLDVVMPRKDYDRLRNLADEVLPVRYKYCDWHNTRELAPYVYAKIQDSDVDAVRSVESKIGRGLPHGIYMDVFPLDGMPATALGRKFWSAKMRALHAVGSSFFGLTSAKCMKALLWRMSGALLNKVCFHAKTYFDLSRHYDDLARSCPDEKDVVGCFGNPYAVPRLFKFAQIFGTPRSAAFEDTAIYIPENCHEYLEREYGDYMALPPVEKRTSTHAVLQDAPWKFGPTLK